MCERAWLNRGVTAYRNHLLHASLCLLIVFAVTDLVHRCLLVMNVLHLVLTLLSVCIAAASHYWRNAHPGASLARNCGGRRHERRDHLHRPVRSSTCSHHAVLVSESRHLSVPTVFHSLTSVLISRFLLSLQAVDSRAVCLDSQMSTQGVRSRGSIAPWCSMNASSARWARPSFTMHARLRTTRTMWRL